jgi:uncharacterized protein
MVPKTERFEMRLDPATFDRIDAWRERQGDNPSRAEAIRRLIDAGLSPASGDEIRLRDGEKLTIWLLTELLKQQKGYTDQNMVDLVQEAIAGGHYWALRWNLPGILHNHSDSRISVAETVNILDMWSFIEEAYEKLSDEELATLESELGKHYTAKFIGFCGNTESEHIGITRFLIEKMDRFTRFKGREFNSHVPILDRYKRMLATFATMRSQLIGRGLSVADLLALLRRPGGVA